MKKAVCEYLELSEAEKIDLWETAIFVFDTNVLLNLYRYTNKTRDRLIQAIEELKDRVWLPHHVAEEFMKDRYKVIAESSRTYQTLEKTADEFIGQCSALLNLNKQRDTEMQELAGIIDQWIEKIKKQNPRIPDSFNDSVLEKLLSVFDGKVGKGFDIERIKEIEKEGKERYDKRTPPGYMDYNKQKSGNNNIFGDLIIWQEILQYAADEKKDIIYITNDQKEDWWNVVDGKTIGPRVELRKEFYDRTDNKRFHMYKMDAFLSMYKSNNNGENIDDAIIEEVEAVSSDLDYMDTSAEEVWSDFYALDSYYESQLNKKLMILQQKNDKRIHSIRKLQNRIRHHQGSPEEIQRQIYNTEINMTQTAKEIEKIEKELMELKLLKAQTKRVLVAN